MARECLCLECTRLAYRGKSIVYLVFREENYKGQGLKGMELGFGGSCPKDPNNDADFKH